MILVTPVGTSLFTNYLDQMPDDANFKNWYETIKGCLVTEWNCYDLEIEDLRQSSLGFIKQSGINASAELQSITNIQSALGDQLVVHLLTSDTIVSRLAAEILEAGSEILGDNITLEFDEAVDVIKGLQVEDSEGFSQKGMTNLVKKIDEISGGAIGWQTLAATKAFAINITGGYKATLPYLTILAQLERVPLYYNFEETDALIKIPQAPLTIDWPSIERYSDVLQQIDDGIEDWSNFCRENAHAIQDLEAFIEVTPELTYLSPIGQIFWNNYQRYFVVDLPAGSYYGYKFSERQLIDKAIEELYAKLDDALRSSYFEPNRCLCNTNPKCPNCYCRVRNLGHNSDLNHGGQISGQNIFIFKSTDNQQIRLLYNFDIKAYPMEVNGERSDTGEITRLTIFDLHCGDFDHSTYIDDWKKKFGGGNPANMGFIPRIFNIPSGTLTNVSQTRNQRIKGN